jgi:queuine tRNA-ribosyltransferase
MPRGVIRTPAFMPVGTAATVKGMMAPDHVRHARRRRGLGNTYHLMLRPGAERIAELGGLHEFARWPHPILTDSGGFQVMSLAKLRKLDEEGVTFKSHIDGSRTCADAGAVGGDPAAARFRHPSCSSTNASAAMLRAKRMSSARCACRCAGPSARKAAFGRNPARRCSASCRAAPMPSCASTARRPLVAMDLPTAMPSADWRSASRRPRCWRPSRRPSNPILPAGKPRYLMGVGTPDDLILEAVRRGVDMFDCVMPTRAGRHGLAYTRFGRLNLKQCPTCRRPASARRRPRPARRRAIIPAPICTIWSRSGRCSAMMLLTWANIAYYQELMAGMRAAIRDGRFADFYGETKAGWARGEARDQG